MLLSVIIVNYNVKYFLEYCLYSVVKATQNIEAEIFVVDNNSTDGSKDFFCDRFPQVTFIWNTINEGFAKANNEALQETTGEYLLFLNPDTIVAEDSFEKCIAFIQSKNNAISCGIRMIDGSGKFLKESKRAFPSPMTSFFKLSGLTQLFPRSKIFSKYHLGYLDENRNHEVDVLAGAFMMVPKKVIETVGGFDESFFMYGEDIDLSFRIQEARYTNYYFSESCIIHFKGESTKKGSLNYVKMFYSAMSIFAKKHFGEAKAGFFNFFIQIAIVFRAGLSAIARLFNLNKTNNTYRINETIRTVIAGTKEDANDLASLFETSGIKRKFVGRISVQEIAEPATIAPDSGFRILNSGNADEIIFCEGTFSFKQIIAILPSVPEHISSVFFVKNLNALIGSTDKNHSGTVILKETNSV